MTDNSAINMLKTSAINILLEETFSQIKYDMREGYIAIAKQNSIVRQTYHTHFMHDGVIYPPDNTYVYNHKQMPYLHWSLLEQLNKVNSLLCESEYTSVKNYFTVIMSIANNEIVLSALLPVHLINVLKQKLHIVDLQRVDRGVYTG